MDQAFVRLNVVLTKALVRRLDAYRLQTPHANRSALIRSILEHYLSQTPEPDEVSVASEVPSKTSKPARAASKKKRKKRKRR